MTFLRNMQMLQCPMSVFVSLSASWRVLCGNSLPKNLEYNIKQESKYGYKLINTAKCKKYT